MVDQSNNSLTQLKNFTDVVADTGDIGLIQKIHPKDATTNPSLLLKACESSDPLCSSLVEDAIKYGVEQLNSKDPENSELFALISDRLAVNFGKEILKHVDGYVSTEVDARLSFDTTATIEKGRKLIKLYEQLGVDKSRILIKIAATYEGIKAAEQLEKEGIRCNLTLIMSFAQAVACAEANVFLISPFVGRINDGYQTKFKTTYTAEKEPGVELVRKIYNYYKKHGYRTVVMAASLRSADSVLELSGVDKITMPPSVIDSLASLSKAVERKLSQEATSNMDIPKVEMSEKVFRWMVNEDEIGNEKLSDGIRIFARDQVKLETIIKNRLSNHK